MNNKKIFIHLFICLISASFVQSQTDKSYFEQFLGKQFGEDYMDRGDFGDTIFQKDFSILWTVKELNVNPSDFNPIRPEPLGFIGENYQRLYIHFSEVKKESDRSYLVKGKSRVRNNICDFEGYLTINMARGYDIPHDRGARDYVIDPRIITQGVLIGDYEFFEDSTQTHVGTFKGTFISSFHITEAGNVEYNVTDIFSDNYMNNQFIGTWKPNDSDNHRTANWGDYRIPESRELNVGACCFIPADEYLQYGWQTYKDAYWGEKPDENARKIEEQQWWLDE